ncbi:MAG: hypothetical protein JNK56_14180, partial [Myxococcales bacterium]|nr:hypothetical protein [Myxococcales bacterium]
MAQKAAKKVPAAKKAAKVAAKKQVAKVAATKAEPAAKVAAKKVATKAEPAAKKVAKVAAKKVAKVAAKKVPAAKKVAKVAAKKVAKVAAKVEPAAKVAKAEPAKKVAGKQAAAPAFALYGELSEKQMRALGQQLDKLQDPNGFKHYQLLAKHAKGPNAPLLWHLLRCGLVGQEVQSAGLYTRFAEYIPDDVTAADVIALLRRVPADMGTLDRGGAREYTMLTPGALAVIDDLLVHAYLDDPAAVRAVQPELPHALQVAIAGVRRRAGEAIDPGHAREILEHLAERHCAQGMALNIDVPRIVDGERVEARLADDGKVGELAALFGTREAWAALQLAWVRSHVAEFRGEPDYTAQRTRAGLATASLRDLIYLFGTGFWKHSSLLAVLDGRTEEPAELLATAAELLRAGLAPFRIDAAQVKPAPAPRRAASGGDDDDGYGDGDDDDDYDGGGDDDDEYDGGGRGDSDGEPEAEPEPGPEDDKV